MATHQIDLPLRRTLDGSQCSSCLRCLEQRLLPTRGVLDVKLEPQDGTLTLKLNYDPRVITLSELDSEVKRAGACISSDRITRILRIGGMFSHKSEQAIEQVLGALPGVVASASFAAETVRVEFDHRTCTLPTVIEKLQGLGFEVVEVLEAPREVAHETPVAPAGAAAAPARPVVAERPRLIQWLAEYPKFVMALIGGVLLLGAATTHGMGGPTWLRLALVLPAYALCAWFTGRDTLRTLRQFKFDIDVLMFVAAAGAAALGHFEEGALLLFLFAIGTAGEEMAMDKARHAIQALAKLAPETAILRDASGQERTVRVEDLQIGDQVVVRPFDRLPADGTVISGASAVDQSPITGESIPAEKVAGDGVFAGTINGEGLLVVGVSKLASQSTLARVVRMVNEAQTSKSPTQVFADRVEQWYVPIVLISTGLLIVVPPLFAGGAWSAWITWFYRAMAFLTAASPCALAIGTPAAVLSGIARAARAGVLIKGGVHLENLGRVRVIAFDKTGTLTRGKPELVEIVALNGMPEPELLALAAAAERNSSHPLARAIAREADARQCPQYAAENLEQISGKGMVATVQGKRVAVGHGSMLGADAPDLAKMREVTARMASEGKTTVVLAVDGRPEAVLALADQPRENATQTLQRLHALGIEQTIMLTGDHGVVAAAMAKQIGVDRFFGDLLPEDKVALVRKLAAEHGSVAMVGDGVNDAPAMAGATVGIAMGGAGTDVALETADVALMADDLGKLPEAIGISRMSRRIIAQNLAIAIGVIVVVAPIAALGGATLSVAVMLHEGSTVVVVCNALRLLFYRTGRE